jgi:hypothetical protein
MHRGAEKSRHYWVCPCLPVVSTCVDVSTFAVALALTQQILPFPSDAMPTDHPKTEQERLQATARALTEVPVTEDDVLMDWIVTPDGVRRRET